MYKYSLWLVFRPPSELVKLMGRSCLTPHIPHVTVETNINTFDEAMCKRRYRPLIDVVSVDGMPEIFKSSYDNDPLHGWGYKASVMNNEIKHEPHLTIQYSRVPFMRCPVDKLSFIVDAHLEVATCHDNAPNRWEVLTEQIYPF
jgi:hypothetical protein